MAVRTEAVIRGKMSLQSSRRFAREFAWLAMALLVFVGCTGPVSAQSKNLAPGFTALPKDAKIAIVPTDIELFSLSAGGIPEPKADWTAAANKYFKAALIEKKKALGATAVEMSDKDADDVAEVSALHAAIARAIAMHHFGPGFLNLPTKDGKLDWSLGEPARLIRDKTGADYALFSWIRDSYASAERVATMIVLAIAGIGVPGGSQVGYASLVDLSTGQIVWFNRLARPSGDLREPAKAAETLDALLRDFPAAK
jgi:hypothetical protein